MLNSHPCIHAEGEIFGKLNGQGYKTIWNDVFSRKPKHIKAVGFKIFYYHPIDDSSNDLWSNLITLDKLYVIHLKRRNILRTLLSRKIAEKQNIWLMKDSSKQHIVAEKRVEFTPEELEKGFEQTKKWEKEYGEMFSLHLPLDVYYEDLVSETEREFGRILALLDLSYHLPQTQVKKQNPEKLSELILNYEELKEHFHNTEWAVFFED